MNSDKKIKTTTVILIFICVSLVLFVLKMIDLQEKTGSVPNTLITCVFTATCGEAGVLGWIKTSKVNAQKRQEQLEDYERMKKEQEAAKLNGNN